MYLVIFGAFMNDSLSSKKKLTLGFKHHTGISLTDPLTSFSLFRRETSPAWVIRYFYKELFFREDLILLYYFFETWLSASRQWMPNYYHGAWFGFTSLLPSQNPTWATRLDFRVSALTFMQRFCIILFSLVFIYKRKRIWHKHTRT